MWNNFNVATINFTHKYTEIFKLSLKLPKILNFRKYVLFCCCSVVKSCLTLSVTPSTTALQVSLSSTISQSLLKFISIESVVLCNHLILCCPLLLLPSVFSNIRVFSNDALCIRWPKNWSFNFSISPSNEYSGLISFGIDWFDLAVHETLKGLLQHYTLKVSILWHSTS